MLLWKKCAPVKHRRAEQRKNCSLTRAASNSGSCPGMSELTPHGSMRAMAPNARDEPGARPSRWHWLATRPAPGARVTVLPERHNPFGLRHRQRAKKQGVGDAYHRRCRSNSDSENEQNDRGEGGRLDEHSDGVHRVAPHCIESELASDPGKRRRVGAPRIRAMISSLSTRLCRVKHI